jgi:hypothetical protein
MAENKKLITVAEAAKILGRSKSAIYAALNASPPRLHYHDVRRRLLLRAGLEERFNRSTRPRVDCTRPAAPEPDPHPPDPKAEALNFEQRWQLIAESANEILDPAAWSGPPWSAHQWGVLAGALEIAIEDLKADAP